MLCRLTFFLVVDDVLQQQVIVGEHDGHLQGLQFSTDLVQLCLKGGPAGHTLQKPATVIVRHV